MNPTEEIESLKAKVERLEKIIREMTEAIRVLTESEERAARFVERIEALLD